MQLTSLAAQFPGVYRRQQFLFLEAIRQLPLRTDGLIVDDRKESRPSYFP